MKTRKKRQPFIRNVLPLDDNLSENELLSELFVHICFCYSSCLECLSAVVLYFTAERYNLLYETCFMLRQGMILAQVLYCQGEAKLAQVVPSAGRMQSQRAIAMEENIWLQHARFM
jgi:hypothetical protein